MKHLPKYNTTTSCFRVDTSGNNKNKKNTEDEDPFCGVLIFSFLVRVWLYKLFHRSKVTVNPLSSSSCFDKFRLYIYMSFQKFIIIHLDLYCNIWDLLFSACFIIFNWNLLSAFKPHVDRLYHNIEYLLSFCTNCMFKLSWL